MRTSGVPTQLWVTTLQFCLPLLLDGDVAHMASVKGSRALESISSTRGIAGNGCLILSGTKL